MTINGENLIINTAEKFNNGITLSEPANEIWGDILRFW